MGVKPLIGPASPPPKKVFRVLIELGSDDGILKVKPTNDAIQTLGMLTMAQAEVMAMLKGHEPEENKGGKIIIPSIKIGGIKA